MREKEDLFPYLSASTFHNIRTATKMNTSPSKNSEAMSSNPSRRRRRQPQISRRQNTQGHICLYLTGSSERSIRSSPASLQMPVEDNDDATVKHSNIIEYASDEDSDASDLSTRTVVEGRRIENDVILPSISLTQFFSSKQAKKPNDMDDDSCCAVRGSSPTELMMKICEIEVPSNIRSQQKSTKMKRELSRKNSQTARSA